MEFGFRCETNMAATNSQYTFLFKVQEKTDANGYKLSCRLDNSNIRVQFASGDVYNLNTADIRKTNLNSTQSIFSFALLQKPFLITLDNRGHLIDAEIAPLIQSAMQQWALSPDTEESLSKMKKAFMGELDQLFFDLPGSKVGFGSEWESENGFKKFKITGIKGALLLITQQSSSKGPEIDGRFTLNTATGLLEDSQVTNKPLNLSYSQKLLHSTNIMATTIDTAWMNMAVQLSLWSEQLKKGILYDNEKSMKFFSKNDALFEKDAYYVSRKLSIIQQLEKGKTRTAYKALLSKTPNHLIADDQTHLHNKLSGALNQNADSAHAVLKYLNNTGSFNSWVQNSFSQYFLNPAPDAAEIQNMKVIFKKRGLSEQEIEQLVLESKDQVSNSYKLITKLNADPEMQQKIKPLYLWVNAKQQPGDRDLLLKTATELKKLSNTDYFEGNGGRYSLLVYQMLKKSKEKKAASSLLDRNIKILESLVADTLNKDRYAHQNLLAGAWYFKYQDELDLDPVKSLQYLSKAAELSPRNKKETVSASFYDRVFLKTEESYRKEFLDKLFSKGNKEEALRIFTEHLNSNPNDLEDMKKVYAANVPEKEFRLFFTENIVSSWSTAPAFVLKGIDGKQHSLGDYKNKWLVIDFWGTWCAPCRKEMPEINSFNAELNAGKFPGINFLSIACNDTEAKVNSYFAENKFNIPAVMSDNQVQKNYNVKSYPSKIVVAPNGKMLELKSGMEWQTLLKKFSELYPAG